MKRQILSLIAGAAIVMTPVLASGVFQPATANGLGGGMSERMAQELNLSETQKTQLKALREKTRSQIDKVLTAEQKATLKAEMEKRMAAHQSGGQRKDGKPGEGRGKKHGGPMGMFKSLNLTDSQKSQIKEIMKAARAEGETILTAEQKNQIKQKMDARRANRAAKAAK